MIRAVVVYCGKLYAQPPVVESFISRLEVFLSTFESVPASGLLFVTNSAPLAESTQFELQKAELPHELLAYALKRAEDEYGVLEDPDSVLFFNGIAPFLDATLSIELAGQHIKYINHFSYSPNVPPGFLPDLISVEFVQQMDREVKDLQGYAFKNIEKFDIEFFFRKPDLRILRLDLTCQSERSLLTALSLLEKKKDLVFAELEDILNQDPEVLRPGPSCIEIEMTTEGPGHIFLPPPNNRPATEPLSMTCEDAVLLRKQIEVSKTPVTLLFSGRGDVFLHPEYAEILETLTEKHERITGIYIETFCPPADLIQQSWVQNTAPLSVIVKMPSLHPELYAELTGLKTSRDQKAALERFERVQNFISSYEKSAADSAAVPFDLYVEIIKIREVEDELEMFYNRFKDSPVHGLVSGYNTYGGRLPDRRLVDFSPIDRTFCWHLARDVFVLADGRIPLCKQDLHGEGKCRSIRTEGIEETFKSYDIHFRSSYLGQHDQIPAPCVNCTEWYTFNA